MKMGAWGDRGGGIRRANEEKEGEKHANEFLMNVAK
jgi:hypothetical protein